MRGVRWALLLISAVVGGILLAWPYESEETELSKFLDANAKQDTGGSSFDDESSNGNGEYAEQEAKRALVAKANRAAKAAGERAVRVQFQRRAAVRDEQFANKMRANPVKTGSAARPGKDLATIKQEHENATLAQRMIDRDRERNLGEGVLRGGPATPAEPTPTPRPLTRVEALRIQQKSAGTPPPPPSRQDTKVRFSSYLSELIEVDPELADDPKVTFVFGASGIEGFTFTVRHQDGDASYVYNQGGPLQ